MSTPIWDELWRERRPMGGRHRWDGAADPLPASPDRRSHSLDASTEEIRLTDSPLEDVHIYGPTSPLLRRHVVHDRRSRDYALTATARPRRAVAWPRQGPIFDQNQYNNGQGVGCCTACAGLGVLMTAPFNRGRVFTDSDVLDLYHRETVLDEREIEGVWPPADTGSAGIYLMKALKAQGLITSYRHAFSLDAALAALQTGPIAVGTVWLNSMFEPQRDIVKVDKRSGAAGGHEYAVDAYQRTKAGREYVRLTNSWGTSWGEDGSAWLAVEDFDWLLRQQGDVVQPTVP